MAIPRAGEKALFFTAILAASDALLAPAASALESRFGPAWCGSRIHSFEHTDYYLDELGPRPVRAFLAWPNLYPSDGIARAKRLTNALELQLAALGSPALSRPVNLDPGYLTLAKLVLASAKNFAHRIHLGGGIYAEVTLQYRGGEFHALPWTFPDYASGRYDAFFLGMRARLATM